MTLRTILSAASAAALLAAEAAHAQAGQAGDTAVNPPVHDQDAQDRGAQHQDAWSGAATGLESDAAAVAEEPAMQVRTVTNGPVRDTPENREKFGGPESSAGKASSPNGN